MAATAAENHRDTTYPVDIDGVVVGGGSPVVIQSMTSTDTADADATTAQALALAEAGSELVRITVNVDAAAVAVPEIRARLDAEGCHVPLVGDFHYNGHLLLERHPDCARALAKLRINPGNVGRGGRRDPQFAAICEVARRLGKPVRIGVNGGSLDQEASNATLDGRTLQPRLVMELRVQPVWACTEAVKALIAMNATKHRSGAFNAAALGRTRSA